MFLFLLVPSLRNICIIPIQPLFDSNIGPIFQIISQSVSMILFHFLPSLMKICIISKSSILPLFDPFSKSCRSEWSFNDSFPLRSIPQEHLHHFQFKLYLTLSLILDPFSKSCCSERSLVKLVFYFTRT